VSPKVATDTCDLSAHYLALIVQFRGVNTREPDLESYVIKLEKLGMDDVEVVGGKNASLGEMIRNLGGLGVQVPGGFATTAAAYRDFLKTDKLDERIHGTLKDLDVDDIDALNAAGHTIRNWISRAKLPQRLTEEIRSAWSVMSADRDIAFAV